MAVLLGTPIALNEKGIIKFLIVVRLALNFLEKGLGVAEKVGVVEVTAFAVD